MLKPELVLDAKAQLAEGPCWDDEKQKLIWVDINGYTVNVFDPESGENTSHDTGQHTGAAVLREKGGLLLALRDGFYTYDPDAKKLSHIHDPEAHIPGNRFNDGKCDPQGRFWAGTMVLEGDHGEANLYRVDYDMKVNMMLTDVTVSNGLAWDTDKDKMYYIDTRSRKIRSFDFDSKTGNIANKATAVFVPEELGSPDGMTIDEEGMLWVAFFRGGKVIRFNPETEEILTEISVPASQVTSCTFGGRNMDELYITTARTGLSEKQLENEPHAGGLFRIKLDVKGAPSYRFKG